MKICFNNQIHRLSRFPLTLNFLTKTITSIYSQSLPPNFQLYYIDHENDKIILSDESDFQVMIETMMINPLHIIKIFIIPSQEINQNHDNFPSSQSNFRKDLAHDQGFERPRCPSPPSSNASEEDLKLEEEPENNDNNKVRLTDAQRQRLKDLIKHYYKINTIRDRIAQRRYESCRKEAYLKESEKKEVVMDGNCMVNYMQRTAQHNGFGSKVVKPCCH